VRIRHVIPLVDSRAPIDLQQAQDLSLRSVLQARRLASPELEIAVVGAHYADEAAPQPPVLSRPVLHLSARDMVPQGVNRRLPLLREVLEGLGDSKDFDVAVFTNADIAVQPQFYEAIATLIRSGIDAGSVTRRTVVQAGQPGDALVWGSIAEGTPHPGHDCFFFESSLLDDMDVGGVTLGASNVMRPLLANLFIRARNFQVLQHLHLTFHIDDSQDWQSDAYDPNSVYNSEEVLAVLARLSESHGPEPVVRFLRDQGFQPHPSARVPTRIEHILRAGVPPAAPRASLGARLDLATRRWPRLNDAVHRTAARLRR
jgi:hypothetical protein